MNVRRYAALAVVLTGGAVAAAPFYRPAATPAEGAREDARQAERQDALASHDQPRTALRVAIERTEIDGAPVRSPVPVIEASAAVPLADWAAPGRTPDDLEQPPPPLPQLPVLKDSASEERRGGAQIYEPLFSPGLSDAGTIRQRPREKRHRIADGDSLATIALRYYGDSSRAGEILAYNRNAISDPLLLPVGVEIAIPFTASPAPYKENHRPGPSRGTE